MRVWRDAHDTSLTSVVINQCVSCGGVLPLVAAAAGCQQVRLVAGVNELEEEQGSDDAAAEFVFWCVCVPLCVPLCVPPASMLKQVCGRKVRRETAGC